MGGRSALMGGTGVALGVDGAAPFLNPATITRIQGGKLAFSSRFYRYSQESFQQFHQPDDPGEGEPGAPEFSEVDVTHHRVHSVPDSVCYFFPKLFDLPRRQQLSICLSTTEEQELSLKAQGFRGTSSEAKLDQIQHLDVRWSRFHLGPTWGVALNDELALGFSLLVAFSRYQHAIIGSSVLEDLSTSTVSTASYESLISAFSWDLAPRIGATYRLSKRFTAGLSLTVPMFHLLGGIREAYLSELDGARTQWSAEGTFRAAPPFQVNLGLGAESESLRLELDVFLTAGSSSYAEGKITANRVVAQEGQVSSRTTATTAIRERSNAVLNLALGAEIFVADRLSLLTGIQTDTNALPDLAVDSTARIFRTNIDYYRAGIGICSYTDFGDLMFGFRFEYGTGEGAPANTLMVPPSVGVSSVREMGAMAVLSGSVNWGSIRQAADHVGEVVRGTSAPPPVNPPKPLREPKQE